MNNFNNFHDILRNLMFNNTNYKNSLEDKSKVQEMLFKNITEDFDEEAWDKCRGNVEKLEDVSKQILHITEPQNVTTSDTFTLTEEILNLLKTKEDLSCYRDWISCFIGEVVKKVDHETWFYVAAAFNRKIKLEKSDFRQNEKIYITRIENILKDVQMTISEFELLMRMKMISNVEFHKSKTQTMKEAKEQLDSLSNELKDFKPPLKKLFNALEKYWSDV
ncbi:7894_t:CDS:1 [Funneliformis geosporum]|uniref:8637_t:CDS:1 n=1 Tax=Funneliformis geosporum TaxID=1117311 RepID=A0A9W4SUC5_9GLOM|nr:7894_t:CDS:1 [Funneliformis geosporum]CAI2180974.1 8637_t:CDS:1 [Funneliformis geosporum]